MTRGRNVPDEPGKGDRLGAVVASALAGGALATLLAPIAIPAAVALGGGVVLGGIFGERLAQRGKRGAEEGARRAEEAARYARSARRRRIVIRGLVRLMETGAAFAGIAAGWFGAGPRGYIVAALAVLAGECGAEWHRRSQE